MVIYYLYLLPAFFSGALFVKFDIVSKVKNIFSIKNRVINIFLHYLLFHLYYLEVP